MLVRELMSDPVVTVDAGATLRDAVGRMLEEDVGSVVVTEAGDGIDGGGTLDDGDDALEGDGSATPAGILTTSDVLRATHDRGDPLAAIPVGAAASTPLVTIGPDRTVGAALDEMADADVGHLPVLEGLTVVGIVTITDVAAAHDDVREEAIDLVGKRREWAPDE